ncbi:MAG: DUF1573 domain-containing protein [Bacteroidota bacterium]
MLSLFIVLLTVNAVSQPKLEVLDAKQNFGFVKKGEVVKVVYDITNKGNQPLIISDTEVSCSCTTVEFPGQPVLPGQHAKIIVSFDTKTVYNRQDRVVYVNSNDPKGPAKLRYKGVVLKN